MYACLHSATEASGPPLRELANSFSSQVEQTSENTVVFSILPLRKLIGSPYQIASEISREGNERRLRANLAIASNPDSAVLLARHFPGVTLTTKALERERLGLLPLSALFSVADRVAPSLLNVLHHWGLKTIEELAILPENGVVERFGETGVYLRNLARGEVHRPLYLSPAPVPYEEHLQLEHSLELLEPLLFLFGRVLTQLCDRLRSQSQAARRIVTKLNLEDHKPYHFELEFPIALNDSRTILKLLQLHLERHPPKAPIVAFTLRIEPTESRCLQDGMFLPPMPTPEKLHLTLARIAVLVGKENVGTPVLLGTHRPDAFEMQTLPKLDNDVSFPVDTPSVLHLALRLFRPALPAQVRLVEFTPRNVTAPGVRGKVLQSAGPWKTSGEWWTSTFWCREEWDIALDNGALYRIYQDLQSSSWHIFGVYD